MPQQTPTPLLTEAEAARALGLSPRYLQARRYKGGGPEYIRIAHRCVRYHPAALETWIRERSYTATCEEPPKHDSASVSSIQPTSGPEV